MNIVVLCGGNSTEREVSINSGSMVCEALRKKNHNAILMDVYFGLEDIDIFEKSASEYDVESERRTFSHYQIRLAKTEEVSLVIMLLKFARKLILFLWLFTERMVKTGSVRQLLIYMVLIYRFRPSCKCNRNGQRRYKTDFYVKRCSNS